MSLGIDSQADFAIGARCNFDITPLTKMAKLPEINLFNPAENPTIKINQPNF
jgi:hypothetical protein